MEDNCLPGSHKNRPNGETRDLRLLSERCYGPPCLRHKHDVIIQSPTTHPGPRKARRLWPGPSKWLRVSLFSSQQPPPEPERARLSPSGSPRASLRARATFIRPAILPDQYTVLEWKGTHRRERENFCGAYFLRTILRLWGANYPMISRFSEDLWRTVLKSRLCESSAKQRSLRMVEESGENFHQKLGFEVFLGAIMRSGAGSAEIFREGTRRITNKIKQIIKDGILWGIPSPRR